MHKALNETLGSLPDDTKVFVSFFLPPYSTLIYAREMMLIVM